MNIEQQIDSYELLLRAVIKNKEKLGDRDDVKNVTVRELMRVDQLKELITLSLKTDDESIDTAKQAKVMLELTESYFEKSIRGVYIQFVASRCNITEFQLLNLISY